MTEKRTVF